MPTDDILNRANFGLLPEPKGRFGSFTASFITNGVIVAIVLLLTAARIHQVEQRKFEQTQLVFPVEPVKVSEPPKPVVKIIPPPQKELQKLAPPKIEPPRVKIPEPPKVQEVKLSTPVLPAVPPPPPPKQVAPPPAPKTGLFASNMPTPVANNRVAPTQARPAGFGDPSGVRANPNASRPANIAAVGSFSGAPGVGATSAGAARKGNVQGVAFGSGVSNGVPGGTSRGTVASAGFANGVVGGVPGGVPGGKVGGKVGSAGFGTAGIGGNGGGRPATQNNEPQATSPELTYSIKPQYTAEARQAKVEGVVTLQVRITASGRVEVLAVVRGLGHGLDDQARRAAEQFRFKPATRNGQPVDFVTNIHVTFQLA